MTQAYYTEGQLINTPENREYISSIEGLERAMYEGRILEAVVTRAQGAQSLTVELGDFTGIIEREEVQLTDKEPVKDIAVITRVGKPVCFKVMHIERKRVGAPIITLSRRAAQLECAQNYLAGLVPGDVIGAKVTHIEQFGAFVDVGCGIVSLLTIDSMSVSRISHPSERLSVGCEVNVAIRSVEKNDSGLPVRLFVSRRELLGTWEENAALFSVGQTVTGTVRSVEPYGIFVELTPNLAGLAEYREGVSVGQTAAVYIKNIIPERMKIKLVIIDSHKAVSSPTQRVGIVSQEHHISRWVYSPECCERVIETVFE